MFVFPSTTDTFGNVVLEAQASGLPVIVTDQGGPSENMIPEKTGYVIKGGYEKELLHAMAAFAGNVQLVRKMSASARAYMEDRSFKKAFLETWELFRELTPENMSLAS